MIDMATGDEAAVTECPSCGVQLREDGTVDAIDDDPANAEHYLGCTATDSSERS